eukprot:4306863-Pyramimonas_sp.AAC.1
MQGANIRRVAEIRGDAASRLERRGHPSKKRYPHGQSALLRGPQQHRHPRCLTDPSADGRDL